MLYNLCFSQDPRDNSIKENPFFKGAEPRCLINTGRNPLGFTFAFIDLYGSSYLVFSIPKAVHVDDTQAMIIPKEMFKNIYWGSRAKCSRVFIGTSK